MIYSYLKTHKKKQSIAAELRRKFTCATCSAEVVNLPRHLRQVHQKSAVDIRRETSENQYRAGGLRKRKCPVSGCGAMIVHPTKHLQKAHHLSRRESQAMSSGRGGSRYSKVSISLKDLLFLANNMNCLFLVPSGAHVQ